MTAEELATADEQAANEFVLGSPLGRAYVWRILAQSRVFSASFTGDALTSAFNEGKRDIGIRVMADVLNAGPHVMATMQSEETARQLRYHAITEEQGHEGDFDEH